MCEEEEFSCRELECTLRALGRSGVENRTRQMWGTNKLSTYLFRVLMSGLGGSQQQTSNANDSAATRCLVSHVLVGVVVNGLLLSWCL